MSTRTPAAFLESGFLMCALCNSRMARLEAHDTLADLLKVARAHQRSEVCA